MKSVKKLITTKKSIFKSKVFWVNVLITLMGITSAIEGKVSSGGILTTIGIINIILRLITKQAVSWSIYDKELNTKGGKK